jgi:hypothetical protein
MTFLSYRECPYCSSFTPVGIQHFECELECEHCGALIPADGYFDTEEDDEGDDGWDEFERRVLADIGKRIGATVVPGSLMPTIEGEQ